MDNQWNRLVIAIGAVLTAATLTSTAIAAQGLSELTSAGEEPVAMSTGTQIPTRLSNEPREDEPDGTCANCSVDDVVLNDDESGNTTATLEIYFEDDGEDEVADVRVRVLLVGDEYRYLTLPSIELFDGQLHVFELIAGEGWSWEQARYLWVEVE